MHCLILFPLFVKYLLNAEYMISNLWMGRPRCVSYISDKWK